MSMRQRKLFKRNSFLQKMLFSILGLICIPLICIQLVMLLHANREFKRETTTHNQYALASLATAFSSQLDEVSNTMYRMCIDKEITRFASEEVTGYPLAQTAVNINRYALDSSLLNSVGVYYVEKDICLHNTFRRTVNHICGDFFPEGTEGYEALEDFLRNTDSKDFFYTGNYSQVKRDSLIIARAFSVGSASNRDIVIFFVMDASAFDRWCTMFMPTGKSFAILDAGGNYLFRGEDFLQDFVQTTDFQSFLKNREAAYVPKDDSGLILYKCRDSSTGFTFLVSMVKQTAEEKFAKYTSQAAFSMAMTVLLTVILLSVTLYINYKPVSQLIQKHFQYAHGETELSELELIDSHFFALDKRLNDQVRLLDTFIIGDLLSGVQVDLCTLEKYFPAEKYRYFLSAICPAPLTSAQSSEICKNLSPVLAGKLVITAVPYHSEMIFVYASGKEIDRALLNTQLSQAVYTVTGQACSIRTGPVVTDVTDIQSSYTTALLSEASSDNNQHPQPDSNLRTQIAEFTVHIGNSNWSKALQTLDKLEAAGPKSKPSEKRFLNQKLLHAYLLEIQRCSYALSEQEADYLLASANGQQFYKLLRNSILGLQEAADVDKVSPEELRKRLLQYVDQNYTSSGLCLTTAADFLKTSVYTVSRIFKEVTGYGFKEYITERRLQQAGYLLRDSDLSITEVAASCGFESTNYFTAVFRMKYGMPPAKYRREMVENPPAESADE